jgi:hypothetical protein
VTEPPAHSQRGAIEHQEQEERAARAAEPLAVWPISLAFVPAKTENLIDGLERRRCARRLR